MQSGELNSRRQQQSFKHVPDGTTNRAEANTEVSQAFSSYALLVHLNLLQEVSVAQLRSPTPEYDCKFHTLVKHCSEKPAFHRPCMLA